MLLSLFSNFKQVRRVRYLIERIRAMRALSGPFLVSRTGDAGLTESGVKAPNYALI